MAKVDHLLGMPLGSLLTVFSLKPENRWLLILVMIFRESKSASNPSPMFKDAFGSEILVMVEFFLNSSLFLLLKYNSKSLEIRRKVRYWPMYFEECIIDLVGFGKYSAPPYHFPFFSLNAIIINTVRWA